MSVTSSVSTTVPAIVHSHLDAARVTDLVSSQPKHWRRIRIFKQDVGTTVTLMSDSTQSVVVKRHKLTHWRRRADALIHGSPARRAWRGAQLLQTHGFPVPQPLAVVEKRRAGLVQESVYISQALPYPSLSDYWRESASRWSVVRRRLFLRELALFVRSFHAAGLYSGDLRDANLLVEECEAQHGPRWRFCLVDLDRLKHCPSLTLRRRVKNLVQLDRTLGRRTRRTERLFFLDAYLGPPLPPSKQRRSLLKTLLSVRRRKDREYARRKRRRAPSVASAQTPGAPVLGPSLGVVPRRPISCCIVCLNEEHAIRRCLESVKWCDEIVVVDSFSTDKTIEICQEYSAHIIQRAWPGYVEQKRFALAQASHEWILNIDADEEVSPLLQNEIQVVLQQDDPAVDGFYIPRLVHYLGRWWWHGWYPSYRLRLFRKHKVRWGGVDPHEKVLLHGRSEHLSGNFHHYTYTDISDHLRTVNSLTDISSRELMLRQRRKYLSDVLLRPLWRFLRFYFFRGCIRDGIPGLFVAATSAFYVFLKYAKLWEQASDAAQSSSRNTSHDTPVTDPAR